MEKDESLIEAVRAYPCLYNSKIADFKVQTKKENAWSTISESLDRTGKQIVCMVPCVSLCLCVCVCVPGMRALRACD